MINKWFLGKCNLIFFMLLIGALIVGCQSSSSSVKKNHLSTNSRPLKNTSAFPSSSPIRKGDAAKSPYQTIDSTVVNPTRQECKVSVGESRLKLDTDLTPVRTKGRSTAGNGKVVFPDAPAMAYRIGAKTCLHITHHNSARVCGNSLTQLDSSNDVVYQSPENKNFQEFDYRNWLFSPYVLNDGSLIALAHSEWYACLKYSADSPKSCKKNNNQGKSWTNAITLYQSHDSGASWNRTGVVASPEFYPEIFESLWQQGKMTKFGFFHPSNIIRENNRYYSFVGYTARDTYTGKKLPNSGTILLSILNPLSPKWEQVTPQGTVTSLPHSGSVLPGTSRWAYVSVTWNTAMCRYLVLFWDGEKQRLMTTTTLSLAKPVFTTPMEVENQDGIQIPDNIEAGLHAYNYPVAQLDPDSLSNNFETTDETFFIFMNSFTRENRDRSLYRVTARLVNAF